MKNFSLILIVLLLYTFPLFAQTKRSNFMYQWKNGSKYFGEWENGTMHGEGTYTFGIGKGEGDRYVGEYRNGIRNGKGIYTWSNSERYVGDFKNDVPEGQGTYKFLDGRIYTGEWKNGNKEGRGVYTTGMAQSSQVNGRMTEEMVRVLLHGKMAINMWEIGEMVERKV